MNQKLTLYTKYLMDFMFFGGIVVTATLPLTFWFYGNYNQYFREFYLELILIFFLCGIFAILIIGNLRKMFKTVLNDDCFVKENVKSLDRMGTYSFAIALVTIVRVFLYLTPAVIVIILTFMIAGLFSKVLAVVFDKAVTYKLENDLTIQEVSKWQ